jgi:uncharacterized protein HemX
MSKLTALLGFTVLSVSSAWAQTPAPTTPTPDASPGSPPAGDAAAAGGGGLADYWWIILLVIIIAVAIWYFSRSRGRSRNQL